MSSIQHRPSLLLITFLLLTTIATAQLQDTLLPGLMNMYPEKFDSVIKNAESMGVQIIYTRIDRDKKNQPSIKQFNYRVNADEYFYPASLIKLPVIAMSLEKINRLKNLGFSKLDKNSRLEIDSAYKCQWSVKKDTSSQNDYPSIAHYSKKMLLVSDNDAYTHLYEFLGQEYLNNNLWAKDYPTARIIHRFAARCDTNANRHTNPFSFFDEQGELIYRQAEKENPTQLKNPLENVRKGGFLKNKRGKVLNEPKDFSFSNNLCLQDINDILISLIFPDVVPDKKRFDLNPDDYKFIRKYMSMYPRESKFPKYSLKKGYTDSYKKYLIYGTAKDTIENPNLRIFNIVGLSYGHAIDCAYIVDLENNTEFFLSAVIYANKDNLMNGKYQYNTVAMPFLANLGQLIYAYERQRKKTHVPDLKEFKFDYSQE